MGDVDVLALRYGQKVRLCAPSAYHKDSTTAAAATSSSSSSSSVPLTSSTSLIGIGYYEKNGRHGILSCVPPLGPPLDHLFNEDEYLVLDPFNLRAPGDVVEYGHTLVLVNQHGMVWNNKTGGITGYIGPRARNIPGEIYVAFRRGGAAAKDKRERAATTANNTAVPVAPALDRDISTASTSSLISSASSSGLAEAIMTMDGPVHFGDTNVAISVVESNRHSQMFNKRLTNFKKPTSKIKGGYICCDGKGSELRFVLCPAKPKVEQISMLNKLITAYNYGQKIALPVGVLEKHLVESAKSSNGSSAAGGGSTNGNGNLQQADIFFKLSNQSTTTLSGDLLYEKLLVHAASGHDETQFVLPLCNGPGELVVKLTGVVPQRALHKLSSITAKGRKPSSAAAAALAAAVLSPPPAAVATPLQKMGKHVRKVPVPIFALLYAMLVHLQGSLEGGWPGVGLLVVPCLYMAFKLHHPLSSHFHASPNASDRESESGNGDNGSTAAASSPSASLKLIITEYRFGGTPAAAAATSSETGPSDAAAAGALVPVPLRYIKAEKGDEVKARERYINTLAWRNEKELDTILSRPWPHFRLIKANYPHFYHKRGKNGEPVYYEKPGKINLKALKAANVTLKDLMYNYLMVTEFLWQVLEPDDNRKCISVLDVEGIGVSDFAGEAVEYVRNAASVSGGHYPERCAYIFIINVPSWFSIVWNTVKTMVDEVTREKVIIIRGSKKKIMEALAEKIPVENIPEEYGGESPGMSMEETLLYNQMAFLNEDPRSTPKTNPIDDYRREQAAAATRPLATAAAPVAAATGAAAGGTAPGAKPL